MYCCSFCVTVTTTTPARVVAGVIQSSVVSSTCVASTMMPAIRQYVPPSAAALMWIPSAEILMRWPPDL